MKKRFVAFWIMGMMLFVFGCGKDSGNGVEAVRQEDMSVSVPIETSMPTETPTTTPEPTETPTELPVPTEQLQVAENAESYPEISFGQITISEGYHIAGFGQYKGQDYSYDTYRMSRELSEYDVDMYWEIVVLKEDEVVTVLCVENEEHGSAFYNASDMVWEKDVNFDGQNDVLIMLGHTGNQMARICKCYLAEGDEFVHCPSFTGIFNPSVDEENQVIRSAWRNWAASHGWGIYEFRDGEFIMTQRLTEEPVDAENIETDLFGWTHEAYIDGEWQVVDSFSEAESDEDTIRQKLYSEDSIWQFQSELWNCVWR